MENPYGFGKTVAMNPADAKAKITAELQKEGFGILTEIDVQATLKKKLDKDIPPYLILGACNPGYASRAIEADASVGLLLPCNVVVRQDAAGAVHVEMQDPRTMFQLINKPGVEAIAQEVREKLVRALAAL